MKWINSSATMNPMVPHIAPNGIAVQCITRTAVGTETPLLDDSQSNGKENLNPTGSQQDSSQKKSSEEQLHMQFQSSSGPPKKRLSPKHSSTATGGKFDQNFQPIQISKSTDNSNDTAAAPTSNKRKTPPSESFETAPRARVPRGKNLVRVTGKAGENRNVQSRPHDLVNAALYPSYPQDSCYKQNQDGTGHQNHVGLNVQFVDDIPRTRSAERASSRKRKYSYTLGHISPTRTPANWQNLVSLAPRYHSCSTVHHSHPYTPTRRPLFHPASQYYHHATPELLNELMTGPIIRTPQSLYQRLYGTNSSSSSSSSQLPIHSDTKPPPFAKSASHHSSSSSQVPIPSFSQVPIHSTAKPPSSKSAGQKVSFTQPVVSTNAPKESATKVQKRYKTRTSPYPKKATQKPTSAHQIIYNPSLTEKKCKCTKSQCLKLYCECFENGRVCRENFCKCKGCKNRPESSHKFSERAAAIRDVLKRNPTAFVPRNRN